jgi:nitrogen fixation protein FixH
MKALLTAVVIIGLLAVAGSIMVGIGSFDGAVTVHPYEKGLQWDTIQKRKESLGWHVIINNEFLYTGRNEISFSIVDRNGMAVDGKDIEVIISRPSSSSHDAKVTATVREEGGYKAIVNFPLYGYWDITFVIGTGGEETEIEERIFVEREG